MDIREIIVTMLECDLECLKEPLNELLNEDNLMDNQYINYVLETCKKISIKADALNEMYKAHETFADFMADRMSEHE